MMDETDTAIDAPGAGACLAACNCGAPKRDELLQGPPISARAVTSNRTSLHTIEQSLIPGGAFLMGDSSDDGNPADGELPQHRVTLSPFSIDAVTVTNVAFQRFVEATGYRTEAETFGFSAVFHLAVAAGPDDIMGRAPRTPWWFGVRGADWAHPGGPRSSIEGLDNHPVVHISHNDTLAYCSWAGRRLPTEAEWEFAARGGLVEATYPWGDEPVSKDGWRTNIWQGVFPNVNTSDDGYLTTAPVRSFTPNGYGLWQAVGNVWEWCADWFSPGYYAISPPKDPQGPPEGTTRVLRGGSFLCHPSYCNRFRNSARSQNTPDSSMGNTGFRTVGSV